MSKPIFALLATIAYLTTAGAASETHDPLYLHDIGWVSALSFDPDDVGHFLAATHFGVLRVSPDGVAQHLAPDVGMLTELVRNRTRPSHLLASGYRSEEEKLGVVGSRDGGMTWQLLGNGADGPVAFNAMALSPQAPTIAYGIDQNLQVSRDGGRSWSIVGQAPDRVFDMAVSSRSPEVLYIAAMAGLLRSEDGGRTWEAAHPGNQPATMVHVDDRGFVHAFLYGSGFLVAPDAEALEWQSLAEGFGERVVLHMAVDGADSRTMLAVADTGAVMISREGGRHWRSFEGQQSATREGISNGRVLYQENCRACHGADGIGERPDDPMALDEAGLPLAPALDDSAHAWHHSDADLVAAILDGSPRNARMVAWREHDISTQDAESLVAYIKSLWSFGSLACQGARHMRCMH